MTWLLIRHSSTLEDWDLVNEALEGPRTILAGIWFILPQRAWLFGKKVDCSIHRIMLVCSFIKCVLSRLISQWFVSWYLSLTPLYLFHPSIDNFALLLPICCTQISHTSVLWSFVSSVNFLIWWASLLCWPLYRAIPNPTKGFPKTFSMAFVCKWQPFSIVLPKPGLQARNISHFSFWGKIQCFANQIGKQWKALPAQHGSIGGP